MIRRFNTLLGRTSLEEVETRDASKTDISQKQLDSDPKLDRPYLLASAFYLAVILFVGLPMWFYTCSITRYSIPQLDQLDQKLSNKQNCPKLYLDISVVQFAQNDPPAEYLRTNLPESLKTSIPNVEYNINWKVRRPTDSETRLFNSHLQQHIGSQQASLLRTLEDKLLKIYRFSNRFRLFIYIVEEPNYSAFCDPLRPHTYTLSFDRFVYLCPSKALSTDENQLLVVNLLKDVIQQVYSESVDAKKIDHHLLGSNMDLLFSLLPEPGAILMDRLSTSSDLIHHIHNKNVRQVFPELKELVNLRVITQYIIDLIDDKLLNKILSPNTIYSNAKLNTTSSISRREIQVHKIGDLIHDFEFRFSKHSTQNVHNVLFIMSDFSKPPIYLDSAKTSDLSILESHDLTTMTHNNDNRSLILNMRALFRRTIGLSYPNLHDNSLVRRDVFMNRWEIDAIMGAIMMKKLEGTLVSLKSIGSENVGVKIPKAVASIAAESYELALASLSQLEAKQTYEAYKLASRSYELSESAYFDPSLLESLYFPDNLKYAIYCPLFVPLAIPLIMSVSKLLKALMNRSY